MSTGVDDRRGPGNYEYVTARVRSRRASLFDDDDYRKLVRMGTGEIARFMEEDTEYSEEMNALGSRYSGVDLISTRSTGTSPSTSRTCCAGPTGGCTTSSPATCASSTCGTSRPSSGESTPGRRQRRYLTTSSVPARYPATCSTASCRRTPSRPSSNCFPRPSSVTRLRRPTRTTRRPTSSSPENAVDRAFYEPLLSGLPQVQEVDSPTGLYVEFLTAEIDFRNLRNALRLARSGAEIDPAEYFIDGGKLFDRTSVEGLVANREQFRSRRSARAATATDRRRTRRSRTGGRPHPVRTCARRGAAGVRRQAD